MSKNSKNLVKKEQKSGQKRAKIRSKKEQPLYIKSMLKKEQSFLL